MWMMAVRALRRIFFALFLVTCVVLMMLPYKMPNSKEDELTKAAIQTSPWTELEKNFIVNQKTGNFSIGLSESNVKPWYMENGELRPKQNCNTEVMLFPQDNLQNTDRIVEQLSCRLPNEQEQPFIVILLADIMSWPKVRLGQKEFLKAKCPVKKCYLTKNNDHASKADAILFKDNVFEPSLTKIKRPEKQVWIMYYLEAPVHVFPLRKEHANLFNWTATYRTNSDIVTPYAKWVYYDPVITVKEQNINYAENKTSDAVMFVSNCNANNLRLEYARELSKYISVDIFGECSNRECPKSNVECSNIIDQKYRYYLAFENANCQDYITEKFFVNGLQHNVIPIVMGAHPTEYAKVAPWRSFIHVEEFEGPKELAAYLNRLSNDDVLYNSYFKWKGTGEFINTRFFCRMCTLLHARKILRRASHYTNLRKWWEENTCVIRSSYWKQNLFKTTRNLDNVEIHYHDTVIQDEDADQGVDRIHNAFVL